MKAIVLHEYGGADKLKYEDWDDPQVGDGQILIRVTAAGINPIDWKIRSGAMKTFMPLQLPTILGYDYSGVVRSVGKGVEGYAAGDKVFGRAGKTYAELLLGDLAGLSKLPKGLDPRFPWCSTPGTNSSPWPARFSQARLSSSPAHWAALAAPPSGWRRTSARMSSPVSAAHKRQRQGNSGPMRFSHSTAARRWTRWPSSTWSRIPLAAASATRFWLKSSRAEPSPRSSGLPQMPNFTLA
jgi:hypothetical protein